MPGRKKLSKASAPSGGIPSPDGLRGAAVRFKGAGDPTRLLVLLALARGEKTAGELQAIAGLDTHSGIGYHLGSRRQTGLVEPRRSAPFIVYSLTRHGRLLAELVPRLAE